MRNLLSIPDYAKECGVARQAIHERIKNNLIIPVPFILPNGKEYNFIDIDKYPPVRFSRGRKKIKKN